MKKGIYQNYKMESGIQAVETLTDSASQKLMFIVKKPIIKHSDINPEIRKIISALKIIRRLQSKYYPVKTRSILRSIDSIDKNGNYKPHLSKQNYPKYKKMRDIKKGIQLVIE